jgi:hypothetical protein
MRSLACASFVVVLASLCGCGAPPIETTARHVTGVVVSPEGHTIDQVAAVGVYDQVVYSGVDDTGTFDLLVYGGQESGAGKLRIVFLENQERIGVLRFKDTADRDVTLFGVTEAPPPSFSPKNGPGSGGEEEVKVNYENIGIKLGTVTLAVDDQLYESTVNPLAQVDNDLDGKADLVDDDDDNDGVADLKDPDADGNQWDDVDEYNDDADADGVLDVFEDVVREEEL